VSKLFPCQLGVCQTYVQANFRDTRLVSVHVHHTHPTCAFGVDVIDLKTWYRRIAKRK